MKLPTHQQTPKAMGLQESGRFITRPSVIILFLICILIYYVFSPLDDISDLEEGELSNDEEHTWEDHDKAMEIQRKKEEKEKAAEKESELVLGNKRYKLYEKKRLNFKKAKAYCKKHDGKLAQTENVDEMRRLQVLLMKAKQVADELWIGVNKKEWKKHALKARDHPAGINPEALGGMNAMMMGGGNQEMCPSLSSSTRALAPTMCLRELPFICEFEINPKSKTKNATKDHKSDKHRSRSRDPRDRMGMGNRRPMHKPPARPKTRKPKLIRNDRRIKEEMR